MDTGKVPLQFAVILILDQPGDFGLSELRQLIAKRILAVPRLRQRLIKVPPGWGRSVWTDDPDVGVGAALHKYLLAQGESVEPIAVAVPVSGRRRGAGGGNLMAPMLVDVSTSGGVPERVAQVEAAVRAHKKAATVRRPLQFLVECFGSSQGWAATGST